MKRPALLLALALAAGSQMTAAELRPGASLAEVQATLGRPRGQAQAGARQVLFYERGEVELQNGVLTRMALRTAEEHAILTAREDRLRDERESRRARLLEEGSALRDAKLADADFKASPVAYQVAFWEDFARRYPEVSCAEPLAIARERVREKATEEQRRRDVEAARIADLEERVAAAERRAAYSGRYYATGYGRRYYHPVGLGPITYTFFDSPLPPYVTPSGNPAGNLTGSVINPAPVNPTWPGDRNGNDENRSGRWHRGDRPDGYGHSRGDGSWRRRERM